MFHLENTIGRGYSAHLVLNRPYSRTHETFQALDKTRQSKNTSAEVVIHNLVQGNTAAWGRMIYNANATISMLQTFDTGVATIADTLTQMAKMATDAATDVYSDPELAVMQDQFDDLVEQVNKTAEETNYQDYYLLNSDNGAVTIYIANGLSVNINSQDLSYTGATDLTAAAKDVATAVETASSAVEGYRAYLKAEADLLKQQIAMAESELAQEMHYGMHIPNKTFALELAHEVMADISAKRIEAFKAQANANPSHLIAAGRNLKQPYMYQYAS